MMKKRIASLVLALCMALALLPAAALAADATAAKTSNIGRNNYDGNWARDIHSLLYENSQGGLTRVEYYNPSSSSTDKDISVIVETYDSSFQLQRSEEITFLEEIDRFGAAFHGEKYNYLIMGHDNRETEDKSATVMWIIQYDQDWNELNSVSLTSADTNMVIPFGHGLHCVEAGDYLHIHSDRYMGKWMTNDGQNHQTSLYVTVKQSDMSTNVITKEISNPVHVSHSFAQYILVNDEGKIVMANHGDAYPRAFRLSVLPGSAESMDPTAGGTVTKLDVEEFMEAASADMSAVNQTDAELGGLVEVGDAYVMVYKTLSSHLGKDLTRGDYQNIYMARIPKDELSAGAVQKIKLTDETMWIDSGNFYERDGDLFSGTPVLVPTGENTGYLMWTNQRYTTLGSGFFGGFFEKSVTDQMFILPYDATTRETFAISLNNDPIELKGNLSDCQPIVYNGKVVWYTTGQFKSQKSTQSTRTGYETTPVFYVLSGKTLTCYQDGKQVAVPSAFYGEKTTDPSQPDAAAVNAALGKDKTLVRNFLSTSMPTTVWTQEQFQSVLNNTVLAENNDPAAGGQAKAEVISYQVREEYVDVHITLTRSGQRLQIMGKLMLPSQKENLGLSRTDPNVPILGGDNESVQSARDFVKSRLGSKDYGVFGNDATADAVLKQAQDMLTRQKNTATVTWGKTGFSLTPATETADGKITGNLFFTDGTARCGLALEIPVKFNAVDNVALLRADKESVQAALDAMNLNNDLTEDKLDAVVQGAIKNGSTIKSAWPGFMLKKATDKNTGSLEAMYVLTNGDRSVTINLKYTIPKLGDQKSDETPKTAAELGLKVHSWAKADVDKAIAEGLYDEVLGKDLTQPVTRAQAAAIAVKIYFAMGGKDTAAQTVSFSDTEDPKVLEAAALGLVSGSNGKFDPDGGFNRESIAVILGNVYKKVNGTVPDVTATKFTDNAKISSWARPAVAFMNGKEIIKGSGGAFDPKGAITGEGMLMMGIGMVEKLAKK